MSEPGVAIAATTKLGACRALPGLDGVERVGLGGVDGTGLGIAIGGGGGALA